MPRMDVPVRHQMMREMRIEDSDGFQRMGCVVLLSGMERHRGEGCGEYGEEQRCVESSARAELRGPAWNWKERVGVRNEMPRPTLPATDSQADCEFERMFPNYGVFTASRHHDRHHVTTRSRAITYNLNVIYDL